MARRVPAVLTRSRTTAAAAAGEAFLVGLFTVTFFLRRTKIAAICGELRVPVSPCRRVPEAMHTQFHADYRSLTRQDQLQLCSYVCACVCACVCVRVYAPAAFHYYQLLVTLYRVPVQCEPIAYSSPVESYLIASSEAIGEPSPPLLP